MRKMIESWRGKPFSSEDLDNGIDIEQLEGLPCQINLIPKEDSDRLMISSVMPLAKGQIAPTVQNKKAPEWTDDFRSRAIAMSYEELDAKKEPKDPSIPF